MVWNTEYTYVSIVKYKPGPLFQAAGLQPHDQPYVLPTFLLDSDDVFDGLAFSDHYQDLPSMSHTWSRVMEKYCEKSGSVLCLKKEGSMGEGKDEEGMYDSVGSCIDRSLGLL